MVFFDFFKTNKTVVKSFTTVKNDEQNKIDLLADYSNLLISSIKPSKTIEQVKQQLSEYATKNKMTTSQLRSAEQRALTLYKNVDSTFVDSNVPIDPEILDMMKYIRVLDIIDTFNTNKKREYFLQRWNGMMNTLLPKMNDVNLAVLRSMFSSPSLELDRYLNLSSEEKKASTANSLYNISENHILPVYKSTIVNIIYKNNEILHYALQTQLLKKKTRTVAISYHGPQASIRIMKGFRYKFGTFFPKPTKEEYWDIQSEGTFWVTNQRIGFLGLKSFTVQLKQVLSIDYQNEKFFIFKSGRENPHIVYIPIDMVEEPLAIISELLNR